MEPLAQDYIVVAQSPDKNSVYAGSPALAQLPNGELVASYEWFRPAPQKEAIPDQTEVKVSTDGGQTWALRGQTDIIWPSLFIHGDALYMIGNRRKSREVVISRSLDGGHTWADEVTLFAVRSHNAPTTVTFQNGYVYRAFETIPFTGRSSGGRSSWESFVVAGDLAADLLDPAAWRISPDPALSRYAAAAQQPRLPGRAEQHRRLLDRGQCDQCPGPAAHDAPGAFTGPGDCGHGGDLQP